VLDSLEKMVPHRRAAVLAAAGATLKQSAPATDYAPKLMELDDALLEELADQASIFAAMYPNVPDDPFPEEKRVQYLSAVRSVVEAVEADGDLTLDEQWHVKSLVQHLARTLEAAPETGSKPVDGAAMAIVGDVALHRELWYGLRRKPWVRALFSVVAGIITVVGVYSSGKELAHDVWAWMSPPPAISAQQQPPQSETPNDDTYSETDGAGTVPDQPK